MNLIALLLLAFVQGEVTLKPFDPNARIVNVHLFDMLAGYLGEDINNISAHRIAIHDRKIGMMNEVAAKHGFQYKMTITYGNMLDGPNGKPYMDAMLKKQDEFNADVTIDE